MSPVQPMADDERASPDLRREAASVESCRRRGLEVAVAIGRTRCAIVRTVVVRRELGRGAAGEGDRT